MATTHLGLDRPPGVVMETRGLHARSIVRAIIRGWTD